MKPLKSALFIAGVFLVLLLTFFFMPEEGLSLSLVRLRNPLPAGEVKKSVAALFTPENIPPRQREGKHTIRGTTSGGTKAEGKEKASAEAAPLTFSDSLLRAVPSIEMSDTTRLLLYHLLHEMDSLRARRQSMHILYYGDSQIEGDRITSVLRDTLQARFGGGGPGFLLPVMTVPFTASFVTEPSAGWRKVNNYGTRSGFRQGIPFGLAGTFSLAGDSTDDGTEESVHCRIALHKFAPRRIREFNRLELWLYAPRQGPAVKITRDGMVKEYAALPGGELLCVRVPLDGEGRKIKLDFRMRSPFAVEGIILEDSVGVGVDNIPLRGRPFMMFSRCDAATVRTMYDSLNVQMVVLQFGLNVAVGSMSDARVYRHTLRRELRWLRQTLPGLFVLVVGVTDMGGDDPALQERLQRIREEQRLTALAEGCAFWDAYLAMGGERAMARWAAQQPSLARPDQAHMSLEGSQLFARMLLKALMEDYQTYTHGL